MAGDEFSPASQDPEIDFSDQAAYEAYCFSFHLLDEALDSRGMPIAARLQAFPFHEIIADALISKGFSDDEASAIVDKSYHDLLDIRTIPVKST